MRINRQEFLATLQAVSAGLATSRETIEQSSCFIFKDERVWSYNQELACSAPSPLSGIVGDCAVAGVPLMSQLEKWAEDEVGITVADGCLQLTGHNRKAGIRREAEIQLPISDVEAPGKWKRLPEDFAEAVAICQQCVSRDDQIGFTLSCLHVHPEWLESCDQFQIARYPLTLPISGPTLIRRDSSKHLVKLEMKGISETPRWLHFKNKSGIVLSCRRYLDQFPDLSQMLEVEGNAASLPKGLIECLDKASVFSSQNADGDQVEIQMRKGKLKLRSDGASGWYEEIKKIIYDGEPIRFMIAPKVLAELCKNHDQCILSAERLKIDAKKFTYVTCLSAAK